MRPSILAMAPDPDPQARERALAPDISFLVRAPAGSGKTELLTQRFLRLLATVNDPETMVALTFTRKAAEEMRGRVLAALRSDDGPLLPDHKRRTRELGAAVRERDRDRGWRLAENPSRLKIMTLDALGLSLVARMPWLTRFGGMPRPTESPGRMYRAAAHATLRLVETTGPEAEAAQTLLRHLHADFRAAETLIADLLDRRDQWLPYFSGGDTESLAHAVEQELRRLLLPAWGEIRAAAGALAPADDTPEAWAEVAAIYLTQEGEVRAKHRGHLPAAATEALRQARRLPAPALDGHQRGLLASLAVLLPRAAAELRLAMADANACDFTAVTLAAAAALESDEAPSRLAFALDARIQHLFVDEFQDTSRAQFQLLQALVREWSPGDGRTLFLVGDPMQSIYGFRNAEVGLFLHLERHPQLGPVSLERVTLTRNFRSQQRLVAWCNTAFSGISPAENDIALSATRFVRANAALPPADPQVELHALPSRAAEPVAAVEIIAAEIAERGADADIAVLAQGRTALAAIANELQRRGLPCEGVKLQPLAASPVVNDLLALTRALLHPADRAAWLAVLRAPWCGLRLADLLALCGEAGQASVAECLASAACRARLSADGRIRAERLAEVLEAARAQAGRQPLRRLAVWAWRQLGGDALLPAGGESDAEAFLELLEEQDRAGALAADGNPLLAALDGLHAAPAPHRSGHARVRLMTIHAAKGLEFDCVIVVGMDREPRGARGSLLRWIEHPGDDADAPRGLLLATPPERGESEVLYRWLGQRQQLRIRNEQFRLLYVAATRARRRLHWVSALPLSADGDCVPPRADAPLARLWPVMASEFRRQFNAWTASAEGLQRTMSLGAASRATPSAPWPLVRVAGDWSPPATPAEVEWQGMALGEPPSAAAEAQPHFTASPLRRQVGVAVHAALQQLARTGSGTVDRRWWRRQLLQAGVAPAQIASALDQAQRAVDAVLADERGRWILAAHADAHCEWALTGVVDGRLRHAVIDRSFVADGVRWIIDYKTSLHEGADRDQFLDAQCALYRPQLDLYRRMVAGVGPELVRCGLYFPLMGAWRTQD